MAVVTSTVWTQSVGILSRPICVTLSQFERSNCESGAQSGADCPACTNGGDLRGKVSENCTIRRAKWGSAARVVQIGCTPCGVSVGPQFERPNGESGAQSGANCLACTNGGDLPGKVSENCTIRRAKWGSAARVVQIGCILFRNRAVARWCLSGFLLSTFGTLP